MTDYELGAFAALPLTTQLWKMDLRDYWLFSFADLVMLPHLNIGNVEIAVALITQPVSSTYIAHHKVHHG